MRVLQVFQQLLYCFFKLQIIPEQLTDPPGGAACRAYGSGFLQYVSLFRHLFTQE